MARHEVTRGSRRVAGLALVVAVVLVGCGDDGSDRVSASVFAERLCGARQTFEEDFGQALTDAFASVRDAAAPENADDLRDGVARFVDVLMDVSGAFDTLLDDLAAVGTPDVEGGDEVRDGVDEIVEQGRDNLGEANELAEGLEPGNATRADFDATVAAFQTTADTFLERDLTGGSRELADAFNEEPDCRPGP